MVGDGRTESVHASKNEGNAALYQEIHALRGSKSAVVDVTVGSGDTLRSLGREIYRVRLGHEPSEGELKDFVADASRRNGLKTKDQQDHLRPDQHVLLMVPAKTPGPAEREEKHLAAAKAEPAAVAHKIVKAAAPADKLYPCSGSWEEANRLATWVTHNEAGPKSFTAYNPDDHHYGVSVGLMQWNQKRGKLPDLLEAWHKKDPAKFDRMFGRYSQDALSADWVKSADFNGNKELHKALVGALADNEFQRVQMDLRNQHVERSCVIAKDHGFTSVRGRAVVADLVNQTGEGGAIKALSHVPTGKSESQRIEALKNVSHGRTNGTERVASIEDRVHEIWRQLKR